MKRINFKKEKIPFTQVANGVLQDKALSLKAKGLYAYLYSKPEGWNFESVRISNENLDGRDGVRSAIKELENKGYLKRYRFGDGSMGYYVVFPPQTEKPSQGTEPLTEKPSDGKAVRRKSRHISNKEGEVIKRIQSNKEEDSEQSSLVPEIIKFFEAINPTCKNYYGNTTQRKAVKFLLATYGFEKVRKIVQELLPATNGIKYMPTITTPVQLQDKWSALEAAVQREKVTSKHKVAF